VVSGLDMRFLGGKLKKKKIGRNKGNEISRFAIVLALAFDPTEQDSSLGLGLRQNRGPLRPGFYCRAEMCRLGGFGG
jgi:hypothetical protein